MIFFCIGLEITVCVILGHVIATGINPMCETVKRAMFCARNKEQHIENLEVVCTLVGRLKGISQSQYLDLCARDKLENARALHMAKHYPA